MRCEKVRHSTRRAAEKAANRVKIASLVAYHCKDCNGWHLGNSKDLAPARIEQLLKESRDRDARKRD